MKTTRSLFVRLVPALIVVLLIAPVMAQPMVPTAPRDSDKTFRIKIQAGDLHWGFIEHHLGCTVTVFNIINDTIAVNVQCSVQAYTRDGMSATSQDWSGTLEKNMGHYCSFLIEDNHRVSMIRVTALVNNQTFVRIGVCLGPLVFFVLGKPTAEF